MIATRKTVRPSFTAKVFAPYYSEKQDYDGTKIEIPVKNRRPERKIQAGIYNLAYTKHLIPSTSLSVLHFQYFTTKLLLYNFAKNHFRLTSPYQIDHSSPKRFVTNHSVANLVFFLMH